MDFYKKYLVTDIVWDGNEDEVADLPTELEVSLDVDDKEVYNEIEDYLADEYEFCVESFCYTKIGE